MKYHLVISFLLFALSLVAQQKGAAPITGNSQPATGNTYAVVIGISDYQDKDIPDLRFADKDAEAFANYLRSSAGGNLDKDHLKLLLNKEATMAQFANALDWLWEVCKEGDQAIIYFSGHGDVEKKSLTQPGFLLCWDAPARVYMAGGAFALPMLQEVVSTLSIQNKAKVIVITDACRSGTLAGSSVGGSQATAANLAKQFANEIKIMSCQPNEYSIEGEQWGGGRGAFSYHLVDALYGLADNNNDQWVTLQEIGRYLEDHVSNEVAPVSQVPMIVGNRNEQLWSVDAQMVASLKAGKTSQSKMLSAVESRGIEEEVLATLDSNTKITYQLFKKTLKDRIFLEPIGSCANSYYELLIRESELEKLHSTMRRNFAAALQDDAQQVMNKWMKSDESETFLSKKTKQEKYHRYPEYLSRAASLLGESHYMYKTLQARKHFFKGFLFALSSRNPDQILGHKALEEFRTALEWQDDLPQVYWQMSLVFGFNLLMPDSATHYTNKAMNLQPSWVLPLTSIAFMLAERYKNFEQSLHYLNQSMRLDSNSAVVWNNFGNYYRNKKMYKEAEYYYKRTIELDPNLNFAYNNLGLIYRYTNRFAEAEPILKQGLQIDSTNALTYNTLGMIYLGWMRFDEAEQQFMKAHQLDSSLIFPIMNLGLTYTYTKRYEEAKEQYNIAIELDSSNANIYYNLACLYSLQNKYELAFIHLEKNLQLGDDDYEYLISDNDLAPLRKRKDKWDALMKKYFPDKF